MKEFFLVPVHQFNEMMSHSGMQKIKEPRENQTDSNNVNTLWNDDIPPGLAVKLYNFFRKIPVKPSDDKIKFEEGKTNATPSVVQKEDDEKNMIGNKFDEKFTNSKVTAIDPNTSIRSSIIHKRKLSNSTDEYDETDDEDDNSLKRHKIDDKNTPIKIKQNYKNISNDNADDFIQILIDDGVISPLNEDTISNGTSIINVKEFVRCIMMPNKLLSENARKFISDIYNDIPKKYIRNSRLMEVFSRGSGSKKGKWVTY